MPRIKPGHLGPEASHTELILILSCLVLKGPTRCSGYDL